MLMHNNNFAVYTGVHPTHHISAVTKPDFSSIVMLRLWASKPHNPILMSIFMETST